MLGPALRDEERDLLLALLEEELADLREEIHKAGAYEFKDTLRRKTTLIKGLIEKLALAEAA